MLGIFSYTHITLGLSIYGQDVTVKEYSFALHDYVNFSIGETVPVIASLGAVIVFLTGLVVGTLSALLIIIHKYYKISIIYFIFVDCHDYY